MDQFLQALGIINRLPSPLNIFMWIALSLIVGTFLIWKTIKIVHQTEVAMIFRRGSVRRYWRNCRKGKKGEIIYKRPGRLHFLLPGVDKMITVSERLRTFELRKVQAEHTFYRREDVSSTAVFSVADPYLVWFVADDLGQLVTSACEDALGTVLRLRANGNVRRNQDHIVSEFAAAAQQEVVKYGLKLESFYITDVQSESQHVIAESQLSIAKAIEDKKPS